MSEDKKGDHFYTIWYVNAESGKVADRPALSKPAPPAPPTAPNLIAAAWQTIEQEYAIKVGEPGKTHFMVDALATIKAELARAESELADARHALRVIRVSTQVRHARKIAEAALSEKGSG